MKLLYPALSFTLVLFYFYLAGSFVANSFDLTDWKPVGRMIVAMCGSDLAIFAAFVVKTFKD